MAAKGLQKPVEKRLELLRQEHSFVTGLAVGIATGIFGNLFVSFLMRLIDNKPYSIVYVIILFIGLVLLFIIIFRWLRSIRKEIDNALIAWYTKEKEINEKIKNILSNEKDND